MSALSTPEQLIEDIRQGKMIVLMDDEDRENEGDLVMAAEHVNPEAINFMAKHARGLICLTLTRQRCEQLNLPLMVSRNGAQFATNFTLSIEAAEGVTTGISAADRAVTVQAAVAKDAKPADIVQPGHIFPVMAQEGGVLNRAGHTEAGCDLARMAGLEPSSVIVEILNEDGSMARRPDLEVFAKQHGLKMGTIADLIEYRRLNEKTVLPESTKAWPTPYGQFNCHTFRDTIDNQLHFALVKGEIPADEATHVKVHVVDTLSDVLMSQRPGGTPWTLHESLKYIADQPHGVVVFLTKQEDIESLLQRVNALGEESEQPKVMRRRGNLRTVGTGSQILAYLGVHKMKLLSKEIKYHALSGFELEIVEYVEQP